MDAVNKMVSAKIQRLSQESGRTLVIIFKYQIASMHWWVKKMVLKPYLTHLRIEIELVIKQLTGAGLELLLKSDLVIARPGMICIAIPEYLDTIEAKTIIEASMANSSATARLRGSSTIDR